MNEAIPHTPSQQPSPNHLKTSAPPSALVVEDDTAIRAMVAQTLAELGFQVQEAESDLAAVACIGKHGAADLLLLDVNLPEMSGVELHQLLNKDLPHLRVIYMTGAVEKVPEGTPVLAKPFTAEDLKAAVTQHCPDLLARTPATNTASDTSVVQ